MFPADSSRRSCDSALLSSSPAGGPPSSPSSSEDRPPSSARRGPSKQELILGTPLSPLPFTPTASASGLDVEGRGGRWWGGAEEEANAGSHQLLGQCHVSSMPEPTPRPAPPAKVSLLPPETPRSTACSWENNQEKVSGCSQVEGVGVGRSSPADPLLPRLVAVGASGGAVGAAAAASWCPR